MILTNNLEYYSKSSSNPPHASSYPDQYLGATQASNSTYDSDESQQMEMSLAAERDPQWFTDFIWYDSDDSIAGADALSVFETSASVTVNSNSGTLAFPFFDSLPESVPELLDGRVFDNTSVYRWFNSTELEIEDPAVGLDSIDNNPRPVSGLLVSNYSERVPSRNSGASTPGHPIPAQSDMPNKVAVPRMSHYICPKCKRPYTAESRLREHLQKDHQTPLFLCSTCKRGFKTGKDLVRHNYTHEPRTFACACTNKYRRLDSLRRHIATQAAMPTETGRHKPV